MKCFMFTFGCGSVMLARKNKFFSPLAFFVFVAGILLCSPSFKKLLADVESSVAVLCFVGV